MRAEKKGMGQHRRGNARPSKAPSALRKALASSFPLDAAVSPASNDDSTTPTPTFSSVASEGKPRDVVTTEPEKSPSSLGPASPPPSTVTTEVVAKEIAIASSSSSTSGSVARDGDPTEVSAGAAGQDVKAGAVAPEFLVWASSTVASSSADFLSKKVAAAVLKAVEDGTAMAAGEREGKRDGRLDPLLRLAKVNTLVLCFSLLMSSTMLLLYLSSAGRGCGRDWLPQPPPT